MVRVTMTRNFGIATGAFVAERDDWRSAIARAVEVSRRFTELTAITEERLESLLACLSRGDLPLASFERVSVHAPNRFRTTARRVVATLASLDDSHDIVVHPDAYRCERLTILGSRALIENMDRTKAFGASVADLTDVFDVWPDAGFCLDVAHAWTIDPSLRFAHVLIDHFGDRLRQVHVSGIESDGSHRPTTDADLARYSSVLRRCAHVPWILESELVGLNTAEATALVSANPAAR